MSEAGEPMHDVPIFDVPIFDVAVIGCGPTGGLLANLLGQMGRRVVVLEREVEPLQLPRAIHFDGEVMRIFQSAGLSRDMLAVGRPAIAGTRFMTPDGQTLMIRHGNEHGPHGWPANIHIHQPMLEAVLRRGMARYPSVELRAGRDVVSVETIAGGALVHARRTADSVEETVRARYVIGCEGARSVLRRHIGCAMEDLGLHQPWLVVDVIADPASERARAMPDYSIQMCDPARPMSVIYVEGRRRRWEIMLMPGDDPDRMIEPAFFWPMLSRWIGPEDAVIERSAVYTFHSLIAQGWRRGPLLLAGDACHQTPPFLGQGMCAALRDAANLAWKLNLVLMGKAADSLLDTYETERRPHVAEFIRLAVDLGSVIQTTDPATAAARNARMAAGDPQEVVIPSPRLGRGVWREGDGGNGRVFPQPRLADGRLLDEATGGVAGGAFAVLAATGLLGAVDAGTQAIWADLGLVKVAADDGPLADALARHGTAAVILRPDGYVFGAAEDAAALTRLTARLPGALHMTGNSERLAERA